MDSFSVSVSTTVVAPPAEVHELLDDLAAHRHGPTTSSSTGS